MSWMNENAVIVEEDLQIAIKCLAKLNMSPTIGKIEVQRFNKTGRFVSPFSSLADAYKKSMPGVLGAKPESSTSENKKNEILQERKNEQNLPSKRSFEFLLHNSCRKNPPEVNESVQLPSSVLASISINTPLGLTKNSKPAFSPPLSVLKSAVVRKNLFASSPSPVHAKFKNPRKKVSMPKLPLRLTSDMLDCNRSVILCDDRPSILCKSEINSSQPSPVLFTAKRLRKAQANMIR